MNFENLIQTLHVTHDTLLTSAAKAVNTAMTIRNWLYGYYIVEYEQKGEDRAKYGDRLIRSIEQQLKDMGQKGISFTSLNIYRQFYLAYSYVGQAIPFSLRTIGIIQTLPEQSEDLSRNRIVQTLSGQSSVMDEGGIHQTPSEQLKALDDKAIHEVNLIQGKDRKPGLDPARLIQTLSFSHIVELIKIEDLLKRAFYEIECVKGTWSVRELQRQIESLYFERSGLSRNKEKLSDFVNLQAIQLTPGDLINNPITVEFLEYR